MQALPFTAGRCTALTALLCTRVGWGAWEENNSPWTGVYYLTVWAFKWKAAVLASYCQQWFKPRFKPV